jgi:hypothetical protein
MASTEEQLSRRSGESFHRAYYPSSCKEEPDLGCLEDLGDLHDPLEEDVVKSHDLPPTMGTGGYAVNFLLFLYVCIPIRSSFCANSTRCNCTDPDASGIAWRSLDLRFPRDNFDDDWSDWSGRDNFDDDWSGREGERDVDDGQVIDGNTDTYCPGSQFSL